MKSPIVLLALVASSSALTIPAATHAVSLFNEGFRQGFGGDTTGEELPPGPGFPNSASAQNLDVEQIFLSTLRKMTDLGTLDPMAIFDPLGAATQKFTDAELIARDAILNVVALTKQKLTGIPGGGGLITDPIAAKAMLGRSPFLNLASTLDKFKSSLMNFVNFSGGGSLSKTISLDKWSGSDLDPVSKGASITKSITFNKWDGPDPVTTEAPSSTTPSTTEEPHCETSSTSSSTPEPTPPPSTSSPCTEPCVTPAPTRKPCVATRWNIC